MVHGVHVDPNARVGIELSVWTAVRCRTRAYVGAPGPVWARTPRVGGWGVLDLFRSRPIAPPARPG